MSGMMGGVSCFALDAGAPPPTSVVLNQQLRGCDFGAVLQNAQDQITVMARVGEVGKAFEQSTTKLQQLWKLGAAGASAKGAFDQLQGSLGDLVKQGGDLAKQIQAAGKVLQSVLQLLKFVQAANAAVAALLPNPFTHAAGRALAAISKAQIVVQLAMIAQMATSIGQVMSAIQQATHKTNSTTAELGNVLNGGGTGATPPVATPPTFPIQQPTYPPPQQPAVMPPNPAYPSYPTVTTAEPAPAVQAPVAHTPAVQAPVAQTPAVMPPPGYPPGYPSQNGTPTVYESGWIPRGGGQSSGLTIDITDADHDGKYEVKVNVPESQLAKDMKITVDAKVGDQEVKGSFEIDV